MRKSKSVYSRINRRENLKGLLDYFESQQFPFSWASGKQLWTDLLLSVRLTEFLQAGCRAADRAGEGVELPLRIDLISGLSELRWSAVQR